MRLLQFDRVHGAIRFIFVLLFGLCAACAQPPTLATTPDPEAARFALANGSNSIEGHASLTLQSGDVQGTAIIKCSMMGPNAKAGR